MLALWTVTMAAAVLLVGAGLGHVVRRRHLAAALLTHRIPAPARHVLVHGLGIVEMVIGTAATCSFLVGTRTTVPVLAVAALYTGFTGYLIRLNRVAPGASCGCFGGDEPAGPVATIRAAVLGLAAWAVVAAPLPQPLTWRWGVLGAGAVVALMVTTVTGLLSLRNAVPPQ